MRFFPRRIGDRCFLGVEWVWFGWSCFLVGFDLDFEPTFHLGPFALKVNED
ncbi:hypothetical protein [Aurantimonas coralicida]|uniref:hypothetical protein n=1 Tax=Aurantimonas coralicida TaxID=182270 RepID=UPI001E4D4805|nr:hypothetical protein [Aurantimonas coralicida]MCD1644183.1 hypothetical protein [Aurantimonas coralicida]